MTNDETEVSERAEAALKTNAEAYRLAQEAVDMRTERDAARAALERIATYDVNMAAGYVDEWQEAEAFRSVQQIATAALAARIAESVD
jgi:hypothetical protein